MTVEITSRTRISHPRLSAEWIEEYLSRRGISPAEFLAESLSKSQNELSHFYKIQKRDVGEILRRLGVDTESQRNSKRQLAAERSRADRNASYDSTLDPVLGELTDHLRGYGWKDATERFGESLVNTFRLRYPDFQLDHASKILARKHLRSVMAKDAEILDLMAQERTLTSIARDLELPSAALAERVKAIDPFYRGRLTEQEREDRNRAATEGALLGRKERYSQALQSAELKSVDFFLDRFARDLLSPGDVARELSIRVDDLSSLCEVHGLDISLLSGENSDYKLFRKFAARGVELKGLDKAILDHPLASSMEIPFFAIGREDIYRTIKLSLDKSFISDIVQQRKIVYHSGIWKLFPFWNFQSYLERLYSLSIELYQETLEEYVLRKAREFDRSPEDLRASVLAELPTQNYVKSAKRVQLEPRYFRALAESYVPGVKLTALSGPEESFAEILETLGVDYEVGNRTVLGGGREIDFYIPELRIGFEINPTHSHNSTMGFQLKHPPKSPGYHLAKSHSARDAGITLIHIYDDLLLRPEALSDFVRFKIFGATRVLYARSVSIERVVDSATRAEAIELIRTHHRQGLKAAKEYYVFRSKDGELIGAASFSLAKAHGSDWELVRLCFKPGLQIRFGIAKLLSHFERDFPLAKRLLTYSNLDYGYSESYERAGFELIGETGPSLSWVNPDHPEDSYSWSVATPWSAKQGVIAKLLGPQNLTGSQAESVVEAELPRRIGSGKGYYRLYKAGSKILVKDLNSLADSHMVSE